MIGILNDIGTRYPGPVAHDATGGGTVVAEYVTLHDVIDFQMTGRQRRDLFISYIAARENLRTALKRVQSNKGAPGVDGMRVEDLPAYLRTEWHAIREQLLDASYIPSPVREVRLPKPGGETRMLKWSHWDSRLRVRARPPPPGEAPGGTRGPRTCMRP